MSYLFYIDPTSTNPVIHPDCVKLCPELSVLDQEQILCLILTYDNHSPFRQLPEKERIYRAAMQVWGDNNPKLFASSVWLNAVAAYQSLQYNPKLELIKTYQSKIARMQELIEADDTESTIKKCLGIIKELRNSISDLENDVLDSYIKEGQIIGGADLSWLEILKKNRQLYLAKTSKK